MGFFNVLFWTKFGEIISCHVNNTYVCKFDLLFGDLIYNKMILCVHLFITIMEFWILIKGMALWLFE